jgi:hypothetical protein
MMAEETRKPWQEYDAEDMLETLLNKHGRYFSDATYVNPTTRYEAWLIANTFTNIMMIKELRALTTILQKTGVSSIIKPEDSQEKPQKSILKRRGDK